MPVRRKRDGAIIADPIPWERVENFRAARFGRYEWSLDGDEYYVQQFSPSLQTMESSPEFLLAHMDYVGIDAAVLQHDAIYGRYNELFAEIQARYPGRFVGLAKIDEAMACAPDCVRTLRNHAEEYHLKGLFFQQAGFPHAGSTVWADDEFDAFWCTVQELRLPVYLHGMDDYRAMARLAGRFPETTFMFLLPQGRFPREGRCHIPDHIHALMALPNVLAEICPIAYGFSYEYPYVEVQPTLRPLYEEFGGGKFCWGSDMPNLERFCTYLQGLDFLRTHCAFISREDMRLILGENAARVFHLDPASRMSANGRCE
jgi:predicted TIM-barrel fold metal-dependent hydrolase